MDVFLLSFLCLYICLFLPDPLSFFPHLFMCLCPDFCLSFPLHLCPFPQTSAFFSFSLSLSLFCLFSLHCISLSSGERSLTRSPWSSRVQWRESWVWWTTCLALSATTTRCPPSPASTAPTRRSIITRMMTHFLHSMSNGSYFYPTCRAAQVVQKRKLCNAIVAAVIFDYQKQRPERLQIQCCFPSSQNTIISPFFNAVSHKDFLKPSDNAFKGPVPPNYIKKNLISSISGVLLCRYFSPGFSSWYSSLGLASNSSAIQVNGILFVVVVLPWFNKDVLKIHQ